MKRLIAFSSVAHMGYVMLGIATLTPFGTNAAIFGMVAHGLITGMLFFIAGSVKDRFHTLEIKRLGGLLLQAPRMGWLLGFSVMASLGLPGLAGFWGEFPAILSAYEPAEAPQRRASSGCSWWSPPSARCSPPATSSGCSSGWPSARPPRSSRTSTSTTCTSPTTSRGRPMVVLIVVLGIFPGLIFKVTNQAVVHSLAGLRTVQLMIAPVLAAAPEFVRPDFDWHALAPELILVGTIVRVPPRRRVHDGEQPVDGLVHRRHRHARGPRPVLTLAYDDTERVAVRRHVRGRRLLAGARAACSWWPGYLTILLSTNTIAEGDYAEGEYYLLVVSAVFGMLIMASARDLIAIFIALEMLSIPAYLLAGWRKRTLTGNEAGMKYYLMGVFASAVMLYGMSLIFGGTGTTVLAEIGQQIDGSFGQEPIAVLGIVFVLIGFAFKISAVPFHNWAPDTYEGAPTPVTAFLSVASKTAGFVAILSLVFVGFYGQADTIRPFMFVLATLTMTVGNVIALRQTNIVRLFAYSSVAQAGFIMAPLAVFGAGDGPLEVLANDERVLTSVITYLLIYSIVNLGAFAVIIAVSRRTGTGEIKSWGGLLTYAPGLAISMAAFLFALARHPACRRLVRQVPVVHRGRGLGHLGGLRHGRGHGRELGDRAGVLPQRRARDVHGRGARRRRHADQGARPARRRRRHRRARHHRRGRLPRSHQRHGRRRELRRSRSAADPGDGGPSSSCSWRTSRRTAPWPSMSSRPTPSTRPARVLRRGRWRRPSPATS